MHLSVRTGRRVWLRETLHPPASDIPVAGWWGARNGRQADVLPRVFVAIAFAQSSLVLRPLGAAAQIRPQHYS